MSALQLTLYVAGIDHLIHAHVKNLSTILDAESGPGNWKLEIVDVLIEPERALRSDIFATPTLVRSVPLPVLKVLGDMAKSDKLVSIIANKTPQG